MTCLLRMKIIVLSPRGCDIPLYFQVIITLLYPTCQIMYLSMKPKFKPLYRQEQKYLNRKLGLSIQDICQTWKKSILLMQAPRGDQERSVPRTVKCYYAVPAVFNMKKAQKEGTDKLVSYSVKTGLPVSMADKKSTQIQLQNTIPTINIETPVATSKSSVIYWKDSTSSESLHTEEESWNGIDKTSLIGRNIQQLVQAFAERARRVKEIIAQPPSRSPTPPSRQIQKEKEQDHPRLESLIQSDDLPAANDWMEEEKGLWCFRLSRQIIPTVPQVLDPQSKTYITWLFIVTLCYVYNAWSLFLRAIFSYQTSENLSIFLGFDYFSDAVYLIDIIVFKVRVKFLHEGFWVENLADTRKNYMKKTMFKASFFNFCYIQIKLDTVLCFRTFPASNGSCK
ncbi:cyclic nucleotide-gated cation channel beta-1-like, partial [Limulus polyphemus]|uniref:Cyclic nucleotide-gated cation channel beta-1-like n=1 Tax=Limulus polyphemus TaxID=6850 RepID=A0ABM1SWF1_LIMPO